MKPRPQRTAPAAEPRLTGRVWLCLALLTAPVWVVVLAAIVSSQASPVPGGGTFDPADGVWTACWWGGGLYTLASMAVMESIRRRRVQAQGHDERVRPGRYVQVLFVVLYLWVMSAVMTALGLCEAIDLLVGQVTLQDVSVQRKWHESGRGCHYLVEPAGPGVAPGLRLCIDEARWNGLADGDPLQVATVESRVGVWHAVAPARAGEH